MARKKHIKIGEVNQLPNVYSRLIEGSLDRLADLIKGKDNITLELACGNGEYSIGLAEMFPDRFFIGVDRKRNRIWRGAKTVQEKGLTNVSFVISHIEKIELILSPGSVEHIWIPFPEPYPMHGHRKKRVIHPRYLTIYKKFLKTDGIIHLKTDNVHLYEYAQKLTKVMGLTVVKEIPNLREQEELTPEENIMTRFESDHIRDGRKIYYISFLLDKFNIANIPKYE